MKNSKNGRNEFKGSLKYNCGVDVNWGEAIVYSDLISNEPSNEVEEIENTIVNGYKQELERESKVIF